jgi:ribose-phosphate pyrophosphokinase
VPVDEHLIEFCLLSDALSREGYTNLVGVIPWMGYSKQDKVFLPGESLAAKVVAQLIQTTKIKKLITFDLHNRAITGFFDIPVVELRETDFGVL